MTKFWVRRIAFLSLLAAIVYGSLVSFHSCTRKDVLSVYHFPQKEMIVNYVKVVAQPYYQTNDPYFYVRLHLESYQNHSAIDTLLKETVLLEDNQDHDYLPTEWIVEEKEGYSVKGVLKFPKLSQDITHIMLHFFSLDDDTHLDWAMNLDG